MTISYPLALPSHTGLRAIELRATNAVAYSRSPFTFAGQAFAYPGQMWQADVTLPPMKRADAEQWVAWLVSLRGQLGTFTMGDPIGASPRGTALANRVNLLNYTEQFNNAAWTKTNTTVSADNVSAPDGTLTADKATTTTASGLVSLGVSIPADSATYTASIYVKYVSGSTTVRLRAALTGGTSVAKILRINSQTGAFVASDTTYAITNVGGGWYRIAMQITNNGTNTLFNYQLYCTDDTTNTNAIGIWGAQLELGSTATTYQPIFAGYGPFVNGASQTGASLVIDGASPDEVGYLLPGDYIQLGSGSTATLHKVLEQVDTDSSGNATLTLWPHIRTAPADNATVKVGNTVGRWRLASNESSWSVNEAAIYGISFTAMEAV